MRQRRPGRGRTAGSGTRKRLETTPAPRAAPSSALRISATAPALRDEAGQEVDAVRDVTRLVPLQLRHARAQPREQVVLLERLEVRVVTRLREHALDDHRVRHDRARLGGARTVLLGGRPSRPGSLRRRSAGTRGRGRCRGRASSSRARRRTAGDSFPRGGTPKSASRRRRDAIAETPAASSVPLCSRLEGEREPQARPPPVGRERPIPAGWLERSGRLRAEWTQAESVLPCGRAARQQTGSRPRALVAALRSVVPRAHRLARLLRWLTPVSRAGGAAGRRKRRDPAPDGERRDDDYPEQRRSSTRNPVSIFLTVSPVLLSRFAPQTTMTLLRDGAPRGTPRQGQARAPSRG